MEIELLSTPGLGEVFNAADAPDETAWREAMEDCPPDWHPLTGAEEATR